MSDLLTKLEDIKIRYHDVETQIGDPEIMKDMDRYIKLSREYKDLEEIVKVYLVYKNVMENIDSSKEILENEKDQEFKDMAKAELDQLPNTLFQRVIPTVMNRPAPEHPQPPLRFLQRHNFPPKRFALACRPAQQIHSRSIPNDRPAGFHQPLHNLLCCLIHDYAPFTCPRS